MSDLEKNKELARQFFEQIWNQGDESAIDRFIAENAAGNDLNTDDIARKTGGNDLQLAICDWPAIIGNFDWPAMMAT